MIQRIQTVFLLFAVAAAASVLFLPLASIGPDGMPGTELRAPQSVLVQVVLGLLIVTALGAVFLYKNRPLQAKIAMLGGFISLLLFVGLIAFPDLLFPAVKNGHPQPAVGTFIVIGIDLFFFAAMMFIRKDEKLVRSADRIR